MLPTIAKFIVDTSYKDIPPSVTHQAKRIILDTIGCALAGYGTQTGKIVRKVVKDLGGKSECTILVSGERNSCANVVFANSKMANALDMDDCFMNLVHFSPIVVFASLGMGERVGATGKELIQAVTLGYDIAARIALYGGHRFYTGCYTFVSHIFGGVVAASKMLKFDEGCMMNAIGIAAQNAPIALGGKASTSPVSWIKYYDAGFAGMTGILSCLLAKGGYATIPTILEGNDGYWKAMGSQKPNYNALTKQLGEKWWIMDSAIKPYPCCRYNHSAIDMFNNITKKYNIKLDEIENITIKTLPKIADPKLQWAECAPKDCYGAMFSIPHCIAMAAFKVPVGPKWQELKNIKNPRIIEFRRKVKVQPDLKTKAILDEQKREGFPKRMPMGIEVVAKNEIYRDRKEFSKGDPWKPETKFSDDEVEKKFVSNASSVLSKRNIRKIIETVYSLERVDDLYALIKLLIH